MNVATTAVSLHTGVSKRLSTAHHFSRSAYESCDSYYSRYDVARWSIFRSAVCRSRGADGEARWLGRCWRYMDIVPRPAQYIHCESEKTIHLTFDHNFGKCRPIYSTLLPSDSRGNFAHTHTRIIKIFNFTMNVFLHYRVKLENYNAADFNGILHVRPQEFIWQHMKPF